MSDVVLYSVGSVLIVSLISLVGLFTISLSTKLLGKILIYMISFAAGGLLGDAFLHLLPEVVKTEGFTMSISLYVLLGIAISFLVEKVVRWRHCHHPTCDDHPHPFAWMNLFGDAVHNLIDGLIIAASYLVDIQVGIATTIAVIIHEIPQEIGDFGVLIHGGFSRGKALFLNFLTALTAVLGVVATLVLHNVFPFETSFLLPFAAGGFIYIAVADLIPELHKEVGIGRSLGQFLFFAFGIGLMVAMM
jgi:zinc and cadmium transporter